MDGRIDVWMPDGCMGLGIKTMTGLQASWCEPGGGASPIFFFTSHEHHVLIVHLELMFDNLKLNAKICYQENEQKVEWVLIYSGFMWHVKVNWYKDAKFYAYIVFFFSFFACWNNCNFDEASNAQCHDHHTWFFYLFIDIFQLLSRACSLRLSLEPSCLSSSVIKSASWWSWLTSWPVSVSSTRNVAREERALMTVSIQDIHLDLKALFKNVGSCSAGKG